MIIIQDSRDNSNFPWGGGGNVMVDMSCLMNLKKNNGNTLF